MHEALFLDPVEADKDGGHHNKLSPEDISMQREAREDYTEGAECSKVDDEQGSDETVYIEEEPWPRDLQATQTSYLPGV